MPDDAAQDFTSLVNQHICGFDAAMGLTYLKATTDEVVASLRTAATHMQPYGVVHGGVLSGMIESIASVGAAVNTMPQGRSAVGLENSTAFMRAVRAGRTLTGRAVPLARGKRSQVWDATIHDDDGNLIAAGRVRVLVLEGGAELAGEEVRLQSSQDP